MSLLIAERTDWGHAAQMPQPQPDGVTRVAVWADVYLVPILVILVMAVDVAVGLNWTFAGPLRLSGPSYRVARETGPIWHLGVLMLLMCALKTYMLLKWGRGWLSAYLSCAPLAGAWAFWAVVFGLAPLGLENSSYFPCIISVFMALMHLLLGLVLSRPAVKV